MQKDVSEKTRKVLEVLTQEQKKLTITNLSLLATAKCDLTELYILMTAGATEDGMNVKDLSVGLGISTSAVSVRLSKYMKVGLITITQSRDDRRVNLVQTTAAGDEKAAEGMRALAYYEKL
ncbi:MAG TPA: hypothetical protein DCW31_00570 [Lactobacillus sp.]|nr:hypothetical protein [Lactobacillus sp.]